MEMDSLVAIHLRSSCLGVSTLQNGEEARLM